MIHANAHPSGKHLPPPSNLGDKIVKVIIPALNEENAVGLVIRDLPAWVNEIVVVDNGSTDDTALQARKAGATVLNEPKKGYGTACLKGLHYLANISPEKPDIVVFLDADYSDHPEEIGKLLQPILDREAKFVVGSRSLGKRQRGSMTPQQIFGNALATCLLKRLYGYHFTDLGPFRAIDYQTLLNLKMVDPNYGWTVEMQLKAARQKVSCKEVPVDYRHRIGVSKVSGTVKGTILAGYKILWTIFKYLW